MVFLIPSVPYTIQHEFPQQQEKIQTQLKKKKNPKNESSHGPKRASRPANAPLSIQAAADSSPHPHPQIRRDHATPTPQGSPSLLRPSPPAPAAAARSDGVLRFVGRVRRALRAALPHRPHHHALRHQVPPLRREARAQGHRRPPVLEVQDGSSPGRKEDGEAQQHLFRSHGPWTRCRYKRGFREGTGGATAIEERRTGQEAVAAVCSCSRFLSDRLQLGVWWVEQFG